MNRGIANKILGNILKAEEDLKKAWDVNQNFTTYKSLLNIYLVTKQFDKYENLINRANNEALPSFDRTEYILLKIRLLDATSPDTINKYLEHELLKSTSKEERKTLLNTLIINHLDKSDFKSASELSDKFISEFPKNPEGYLSKGSALRRLKYGEEAIPYLERATELSRRKPQEWIWLQLGIEFYELSKYEQTIKSLIKIKSYFNSSNILQYIILSNFYLGNYTEAIEQCKASIKLSEKDATASEVLFRIYLQTGQTNEAINTLENYLRIGNPNSLDHFRLLGAKFYYRNYDSVNLLRLLRSINNPYNYSLNEQFTIVKMLYDHGELEIGQEIAYNSRILNFNSHEVHEYYVKTIIYKPEELYEKLFPKKIEIETAVKIIDLNHGQEYTYFITDDPRLSGAHILRVIDSMTQSLLGKSIDEEIILEKTNGLKTFKISTILSKHTFSYQESLDMLSNKFAQQTDIIFFEGNNESTIEKVREFMRTSLSEDAQLAKELFSIYDTNPIPIGMLATKFNITTLEMWLTIIHQNQVTLKCRNRDESNDFIWMISNKKEVVLEITALLTIIGLLDKSEILKKMHLKYYIAQATLDEIIEHRKKLISCHPPITIVYHEDQLKKYERTAVEINSEKEWIDRLIDWCKENTTVHIPKIPIQQDKDINNLENTIGKASYHSLLIAQQFDLVLLSDDANLKDLGFGEFEIRSFSSYEIILQNLENSILPMVEFASLSKILIKANYTNIAINADILWELYIEEYNTTGFFFSRSVARLTVLHFEETASIISKFAKIVFINIVFIEKRAEIIKNILLIVRERKDFGSVKNSLLNNIEFDFNLLPVQKDDLRDIIEGL